MNNIPNWKLKDGTEMTSVELFPEGTLGFIYLIHNVTNGKKYIGRKSLWSTTKKHFGKKKLATVTDKRLKTYEMVTKESNWKGYKGSNKPLLADIKEGDQIERYILSMPKTKKMMTYYETYWLIKYDVLSPKNKGKFYNDNILGKFFSKDFIDDPS